MKASKASKAKNQMLILGVGSILITLAMLVLAVTSSVQYAKAVKGASLYYSAADASKVLELIMLLALAMAAFFAFAIAADR